MNRNNLIRFTYKRHGKRLLLCIMVVVDEVGVVVVGEVIDVFWNMHFF